MGQGHTELEDEIDEIKNQPRIHSLSLQDGKLKYKNEKDKMNDITLPAASAPQDLSVYAKKTDLGSYAPATGSTEYATKTDLDSYAPATGSTEYAKKTDLPSSIKFTQNWSGLANTGNSEISNDIGSFKSLMLAGNNSSGVRKVSVWDDLDVMRDLKVSRNLNVIGEGSVSAPKATIAGINISGSDIRGTTQIWSNDEGMNFFPGDGKTTKFFGPTTMQGDLNVTGTIKKNGVEIGQQGLQGPKGDTGVSGEWQGPYQVKFVNKNKCLNSGQFGPLSNGEDTCADNDYMKWMYNPSKGQLKSVQEQKCLDRTDGQTKWQLLPCVDHPNQHFTRFDNTLRHKNRCLDVGNNDRSTGCQVAGDNVNQMFIFQNPI